LKVVEPAALSKWSIRATILYPNESGFSRRSSSLRQKNLPWIQLKENKLNKIIDYGSATIANQ